MSSYVLATTTQIHSTIGSVIYSVPHLILLINTLLLVLYIVILSGPIIMSMFRQVLEFVLRIVRTVLDIILIKLVNIKTQIFLLAVLQLILLIEVLVNV